LLFGGACYADGFVEITLLNSTFIGFIPVDALIASIKYMPGFAIDTEQNGIGDIFLNEIGFQF